jgi:hypothetical protein
LLKEPYQGLDWSRGLRDLAQAIDEERPHRCSAEMAAHIVEIVEACYKSIENKGPVKLQSQFQIPEPMPWAR